MRSATSSQVARLLTMVAGALLAQCQPAPVPTPTPSPTATPTPHPEYPKERWGVIVLYEKAGACKHLAGPPRISVARGGTITWRIFNECRKEATVEITDLRLSPSDDEGFTYADTWEKIKDVKQKRQDKEKHKPRDPFAPGDRSKRVAGGSIADLALTVREDAEGDLYTYLVLLDGVADEGDIEIWPPRP